MPAPQNVLATPSVPGEKHYILYARQNLKDTRLILLILFVGYAGYGVYDAISHGNDVGFFLKWAVYSSFPIFVYGALWLYGRFTYAAIDDDGVRVRFLRRKAWVPFSEIEKVRIETLERLFDRPERARMRTRSVKNLGDQRALCIRLRDDEEDLPAIIRRRLGPRMVLDRELVLPITNADGAFMTVRSRLGTRRSQAAATADAGESGRRRRRKKNRR